MPDEIAAESLITVEDGRPARVADRLVEIRAEISARFVEMGELLLESKRHNYAALLGYASFEAYIEDRLDMGYRKACYLAEIFKVYIEDLGVPRETLAAV